MDVLEIHTNGKRTLAEVMREVPREPLFVIDETTYTIPMAGAVPPALGLQAMELYRTGGDGMSTPFILEHMLGPDGYRALRECVDITPAQMEALTVIIRERVYGPPENETGKG